MANPSVRARAEATMEVLRTAFGPSTQRIALAWFPLASPRDLQAALKAAVKPPIARMDPAPNDARKIMPAASEQARPVSRSFASDY